MTEAQIAELVLTEADRLGYWRPHEGTPWDLFLFGLRHPTLRAGAFDDALGAVWWQADGWHARLWPGTTDPGVDGDSGDDPHLHGQGTAILQPGQVRGMWQIGIHHRGRKGEHRAFVQVTEAPFRRDRVSDGMLDDVGPVFRGLIGCNGHKPWRDGLERVGYASLACQVWKRREDHDEALALADQQRQHHPTWTRYTYTLFDTAPERPASWGIRTSPTLRPLLDLLGAPSLP